jgi:hypothetical protein
MFNKSLHESNNKNYNFMINIINNMIRTLDDKKIDNLNVNNFNTDAENFKKQITSLQIEKANLENEIHQLKNTRKLTLKERLSGKTEIKNQ